MNHDLSTYRKRSVFSQQDIADMIGKYDAVQISRIELSTIHPQVELLLLYSLLYKKPIDQFFPPQMDSLKARLRLRIPNIINEWQCIEPSDTINQKIACLERILSELNHPTI